ncbi:MAG TPA: flagellar hook-basal body protein [Lachnospiraceae bacterium]|nr:flagellar hook-basal body protein [Lachnospiraceae bacterium]
MLKGLYTAYTGMLNEQHRMDTLSNNLANAATTGYKKEGATSQAFSDLLAVKIKDTSEAPNTARKIGSMNMGVKIGENYTNYDQGSFKSTSNTYDLALSGAGFFAVEFTDKSGEVSTKYTRDGSFTLTEEGYLVTKDGDFVMGKSATNASGFIKLNPLSDSSIDKNGTIYQNDVAVAQLQITDFSDYNYLEHYGENYYQPVEGATLQNGNTKVFSGYLEMSNVQVVSEMVDMISTTRQYEANQKIINAYDETLEIAVNQLGRV